MLRFVQTLYWNWRLDRVCDQLQEQLRNECEVVELEVGDLTLTSYDPAVKRQGEDYYHSIWDGEAFFPFWGDRLQISLSAFAPRPPQHQLEAVRSILEYPHCIRPDVEQALFEYYRDWVYGCVDVDLEGRPLPEPTKHRQIQKLMFSPEVSPDAFREEGDPVSFQLRFECKWDEEHELIVLIEDW